MKKVLITGATGALGQALIEQLQTLKTYKIFATSTNISLNNKYISTMACNFNNLPQLTSIFNAAQPDLVLHLGAAFIDNLLDAYHLNVAPAQHLLQLVQNSGHPTRVVLIGSAAEYGFIRAGENPVSEDHVLFPVSPYGVSKAWQTQLLGVYSALNVDVVCARIFNLFGPGISTRLFAGYLQKQINAVKAGHRAFIEVGSLAATRDYITTSEAAAQLLLIAQYGLGGNVYHVGSGQPVTMRDFMLSQLALHELPSSLVQEAPEYSNRVGYDVPVIFANMQKTQLLARSTKICQN